MKRSVLAAALVVALVVGACGGGGDDKSSSGGSSGPFAPRDKAATAIKGQEITVLMPYKVPKEFLADFTAKTGVKVNYDVTGWDAVHSKLIVGQHGEDLHRRRDGVRLVVHRPVRGHGLERAAREGARPRAPGRHEAGQRRLRRRRAHVRRLLLERLPDVALQRQDVQEGGARRSTRRRSTTSAPRSTSSRPPACSTRSRSRWAPPRAASRRGTCSRWRWAASCSTRTSSRSSPTRTRPATRRCSSRSTRSRTAGSRPAP